MIQSETGETIMYCKRCSHFTDPGTGSCPVCGCEYFTEKSSLSEITGLRAFLLKNHKAFRALLFIILWITGFLILKHKMYKELMVDYEKNKYPDEPSVLTSEISDEENLSYEILHQML